MDLDILFRAARDLDSSAHEALSTNMTAGRRAQLPTSEFRRMQADVEKLLMITEAMWRVLKSQHGYNDDDLLGWVQEIDMRDGQLDGKVGPVGVAHCPDCGRALLRSKAVCMYCGREVEQGLFER